MKNFKAVSFTVIIIILAVNAYGRNPYTQKDVELYADPFDPLSKFKTNFKISAVDPEEILPGGPSKDGIPSIIDPNWVSYADAGTWLEDKEPVISVYINGQARAYPLQILIWHEAVNDVVGGVPVVVTFSPLSYSTIVYDRRVGKDILTFGITGYLRKLNTILYDYKTESFWQQITGNAIVGDLTGAKLIPIPCQIISFEQFQQAYPEGLVLSTDNQQYKDYGTNPYYKFDRFRPDPYEAYVVESSRHSSLDYYSLDGKDYDRQHDIDYEKNYTEEISPMERILVFNIGDVFYGYPYSFTFKQKVFNDEKNDVPFVIFHLDGAVSAVDERNIPSSKEIGSTGIFDRRVDGEILTFSYTWNTIMDQPTNSVWDITGHAIAGMLKGKRLKPIVHGNFFTFTWLSFHPATKLYVEQI